MQIPGRPLVEADRRGLTSHFAVRPHAGKTVAVGDDGRPQAATGAGTTAVRRGAVLATVDLAVEPEGLRQWNR